MKLSKTPPFSRILVFAAIGLLLAVEVLVFIKGEYLIALLLGAFIMLYFFGVFTILANRSKLIDKYHGRLLSLISSLRLEIDQQPFSQEKKFRSLVELEPLFNELHQSISKKTTELRTRNTELKKKQIEALKQNRELLKANEALRRSRERYEKLVSTLEEEYFIYQLDTSGQLEFVSSSIEKILGYTPNEFIKQRPKLTTKNPINKTAAINTSKVLKGTAQSKFLFEIYHANSETRMLEISETPVYNTDNKLESVEGIAHDITERYNAEELIREQEKKYRQVFNSASDFIFLYNLTKDKKPDKFIEANLYTQEKLGYSQEELLQMTPEDLSAAEIWNDKHDRDIQGKYERIWEAKDGTIINVEISEHSFKMKNKTACIAVARDITDRKRAVEEITFMNEELVNQKENLEALLDNLTQTQEQLVQSEKMAALGQLIAGVAHEINTPLGAIQASVGNLSDSLETALGELPALFQTQSENSLKLFLLIFKLSAVKKPDLSTREKREHKRAIRKELKAEGVEQADMIADLMVYLDIYEGYQDNVDLLKQDDALTVLRNARDFISLKKNTKTINIAASKASKVVFALKKYAHRDSLGEKVPTDIVDGIETILTLYDSQLKQGIKVVKNFKDIPMIMSYQDEINQVWTNLIQNGIQAIGQDGTLTINAHADEKNIFVSIIDTGEGIDPSILDKIFDPFFTTKKQGEGSGLGLDIVKKIIDKHAGLIDVTSEMGKGSTFLVTLPLF